MTEISQSSRTTTTWVLALTSTASLMVALDLLVVATALPEIGRDLGITVDRLQWTVTAYGLAFACLLMTGAALGDRFGRRRVLVVGLVIFASASVGCALSPTIGWLIAWRTIQGAGAALVLPLAVSLLSATVPAEQRGRALGIFEGVTGIATIAGPPVGGLLAQTAGWEWIFWINVPVAAVVAALVLLRVPESRGRDATLDMWGVVLITLGGFGLVWFVVRGNESGWLHPSQISALVVGIAASVAFVAWQRRARHPMFPLGLLRSRAFAAGAAASFLGFAALYGSVFFLSQFLQTGLGLDPLEAGVRLIPWTATLLVIAPLAGLLADRIGDRPVLIAGLLLQALGLLWMGAVAAPDTGYAALVPALLVSGAGASMAIPVVQNVVIGGVPHADLGKASGANNMTQELGGAVGVAVLVAVFTAAGGELSSAAFIDGFRVAIVGCGILAAIAATVAVAIPAVDHR